MGLLSTIGAASGRAFGLTRVGAAIRDAYFNLVTLLLPGNGTNGAQNNTFLDSSTNNFTITRNGNTTQGTFSPFSQTGWSNFFDGTGDYLSLTIGSTTIGSGDFTIEFWYYPTAFQNFDTMFSTTRGANGFNIGTNASASVVWYSSSAEQINSGTLTQNAWNHIAFTRTSNTLRLYLNGSQTGATPTVSTNFSATSCWIGDLATSGSEPSQGYISNLRVVTQSLASGSTYTVSTTPLTAIANTSLLTCQSNRFIDNSSNAFAITRNGDVSVQAFSPFAPTAAYDATTVGGSGYLDGTGDYLSVASNAAFQFGTGDFTVEAWWYPTTISSTYQTIVGVWVTGNLGWILQARSTDILISIGSGFFTVTGSATIVANQWYHVAASRNGTTVRVFLNGTQLNTGTSSASGTASTALQIGRNEDGNQQYVNGYLSSLRIVKGQGLATGSFTPPTAPVTTTAVGWTGANAASSITGTVSILTNFTNAGITDATAKNALETVGNAQISTTQSKFGGSSMYFDGTGDGLILPASPFYNFLDGNFTVEAWVYIAGNSPLDGLSRRIANVFSVSTSSAFSFNFIIRGDGTTTGTGLEIYNGTNIVNVTGTISQSTWHHIAVTKSGTSVYFFLNGTQMGTTQTTSGNWGSATVAAQVGRAAVTSYTFDLNGYIDDLRITRFARYTANFTAPTSAFALQ